MSTATDFRFQHVLSTDEYSLYYKAAWGNAEQHDGAIESTIVRTPFSTRIEEIIDLIPENESFQISVYLDHDVATLLGTFVISNKRKFDTNKFFTDVYKNTGYVPPQTNIGEKLDFCSECDIQIPPDQTVAGWNTCEKCEE